MLAVSESGSPPVDSRLSVCVVGELESDRVCDNKDKDEDDDVVVVVVVVVAIDEDVVVGCGRVTGEITGVGGACVTVDDIGIGVGADVNVNVDDGRGVDDSVRIVVGVGVSNRTSIQ